MAFVKIWIHAVWTTKDRKEFLIKEVRQKLFDHIREYAKEKDIYIDFINGYINHVHCLISLNPNQNLSEVINLIKGESSHWINKNQLTEEKFAWQNKYYAASVSESHVDRVREYIKNQEAHHQKQTLQEEVELWPSPIPGLKAGASQAETTQLSNTDEL